MRHPNVPPRLWDHPEASRGGSGHQFDDLRATLYRLDTELTLHFAQEEEAYFTLPSA